jgi:AraC-like DNA-binding protein
LGRHAGLGRSAFSARFTRLVGQPVHRYLVARRMDEAALMLASSDDAIARIATRVGYETTTAFSRAFHQHYGFSPRQRHGRLLEGWKETSRRTDRTGMSGRRRSWCRMGRPAREIDSRCGPGASLIGPAQFERRVFNAPPQAMTSSSGPGSRVGQRGGGRPITARPTGSNQVLATATLEPSSALLVIAPDHASRLLLIALGGWPRCRFDLGVDQALELSLALVAAVNSLGIQEIKFDGYRAQARGD